MAKKPVPKAKSSSKHAKAKKARAQARLSRDRVRRETGGLGEDEFIKEQFSHRIHKLSIQRVPDPRVVEQIERLALGKGRTPSRDVVKALMTQGEVDADLVEMRFSLTRIELTRVVRMPQSPGSFLDMRLCDGHRLAHLMDDDAGDG